MCGGDDRDPAVDGEVAGRDAEANGIVEDLDARARHGVDTRFAKGGEVVDVVEAEPGGAVGDVGRPERVQMQVRAGGFHDASQLEVGVGGQRIRDQALYAELGRAERPCVVDEFGQGLEGEGRAIRRVAVRSRRGRARSVALRSGALRSGAVRLVEVTLRLTTKLIASPTV